MPVENNVFGVELAHVLAGIAGGVVRAIVRPGHSLWQGVSTTVVGVLTASYATPLAKTWLGVADADQATANAVAFGIGLVGMSVAEGLISLANAWAIRPRLPASFPGSAAINDAQPPTEPTP